MPLYEYKCSACGEVFEILQRFSDPPLEVHDGCGGRVERLLSAPALQFKGTGWYVTDYGRSASRSNGKAKESSEGAGKKPETASKGDSAPAKSPEAKPAKSGK